MKETYSDPIILFNYLAGIILAAQSAPRTKAKDGGDGEGGGFRNDCSLLVPVQISYNTQSRLPRPIPTEVSTDCDLPDENQRPARARGESVQKRRCAHKRIASDTHAVDSIRFSRSSCIFCAHIKADGIDCTCRRLWRCREPITIKRGRYEQHVFCLLRSRPPSGFTG